MSATKSGITSKRYLINWWKLWGAFGLLAKKSSAFP
jgi:hypothetical protein